MTVLKPPMGFNTWNTFGGAINDKLIMETADAMAESGLKELGYEYVVTDDCWSEKRRDADGRLVPSREKFPNGIKPVAVHKEFIREMRVYTVRKLNKLLYRSRYADCGNERQGLLRHYGVQL